jgi:hypothetical protein
MFDAIFTDFHFHNQDHLYPLWLVSLLNVYDD